MGGWQMDHLACFIPGMLVLGAEGPKAEEYLQLAKEVGPTCPLMRGGGGEGGVEAFVGLGVGPSSPAPATSSTTACPPSSAGSTTSSETDRWGGGGGWQWVHPGQERGVGLGLVGKGKEKKEVVGPLSEFVIRE